MAAPYDPNPVYAGKLATKTMAGPASSGSNTGLDTSYRAVGGTSAPAYAGRSKALTIELGMVFASAGTPITSITVKLMGRDSSSDQWRPLFTVDQSDTSSTTGTAIEHTYARASGDAYTFLQTESHQGVPEVALFAKYTGGTSAAGDQLTAIFRAA